MFDLPTRKAHFQRSTGASAVHVSRLAERGVASSEAGVLGDVGRLLTWAEIQWI